MPAPARRQGNRVPHAPAAGTCSTALRAAEPVRAPSVPMAPPDAQCTNGGAPAEHDHARNKRAQPAGALPRACGSTLALCLTLCSWRTVGAVGAVVPEARAQEARLGHLRIGAVARHVPRAAALEAALGGALKIVVKVPGALGAARARARPAAL